MNESWNDVEQLAALLDGRLSKRERATMMTYLTVEDTAYQVVARTAVILREAEWENSAVSAAGIGEGEERVALDALLPLSGSGTVVVDTLTDEFDALFAKMQTPEVRRATRRAFDASPDELRTAAIEAARRSEG